MSVQEFATRQPPLTDGGREVIPWLRHMRAEKPVTFDETMQAWFVYRHDDVTAIMSDPARYSSELYRVLPGGEMGKGNLAMTDPPKHRASRKLVSQAFTPKVVTSLAPRIAEIAGRLLDRAAAEGGIELMRDLALPLPVIVIAELLGLPAEDHELIATWATQTLGIEFENPADEAFIASLQEAQREMNEYLGAAIARKRVTPGDDLLSNLIAAEVDGERMDSQEIEAFSALLLFAGHITTTALLGNMWICLEEAPGTRAELRADPALFPQAIEEVLRYRTPFTQVSRVPNEDVTLRGQTIKRDSIVFLSLISANRDERRFVQPDTFDIRRTDRHSIAFGHGIHYCLGAALAKQEAEVVYTTLFDKFPRIHRGSDSPIEFWQSPGILSPKRLELSF